MENKKKILAPEERKETLDQLRSFLTEDPQFSEDEAEQLLEFSELVLRKNEVMNLTAITDGQGFYIKHILDSLSLLPLVKEYDLSKPMHFLDVGSGAGFPGIPLAIMCPQVDFVLLDSLQKRVGFLSEVVEDLHLQNVTPLHARAEEAGKNPTYREKFSFVSARAVSNLPTLLELCVPFVQVGGHFWAMKGTADELSLAQRASECLGVKLAAQRDLSLPADQGSRVILDFVKVKPTPPRFPRKPGIPGKQPLL